MLAQDFENDSEGLRMTAGKRFFATYEAAPFGHTGHARRWYNYGWVVFRATRTICMQETPGELP
jgi:hypothetical protein